MQFLIFILATNLVVFKHIGSFERRQNFVYLIIRREIEKRENK
jgi:hypothetical protein